MGIEPKKIRRLVIGVIVIAVLIHLLGGLTNVMQKERATRENREDILFGTTELTIERAETSAERERGLSGRVSIGSREGLLFVFETSERHGFWMKDMHFPIDIIWFDEGGTVVHIEDRVAPKTFPRVFRPAGPARYVLEVPAGLSEESGVTVGGVVSFKK